MNDHPDLPLEPVSDHYTIAHERLRGEVCEFQRVAEKVTGREAAILRLVPALASDPQCREAFVAWARLAARWTVRHALPVHGVACDAGGIYVITDWPDGGTLESGLRSGTIDESALERIRSEVEIALADARAHGIAHGRVVPEEIFLQKDGSSRLGIFGIGLADDELSTLFVEEKGSPVRRLPVSATDDAERLASLGQPVRRSAERSPERQTERNTERNPSRPREESSHVATQTAGNAATRGDDSEESTGSRGEFPWRPLAEQYRVDAILGAGGMGSVHRALELATGRIVAIKRMKNADPSAIKRFQREASAIARLNHPHVLNLMQAARDEDGDYLVLECAPNGSLADRLKKDGKLPPEEVLTIARKIGAALSYAHGKGCIHRDVKPHNILLSESNEPKLADFGLARALDDVTLTTSSAGAGSPVYMPPEQWQDGRRADARSDVYAFAKTLYHLLTGEKPATIDRRLVTPEIHAVLKRATEQEPEDRPATIDEFVRSFERAFGAATGTHRSPTSTPGAARRLSMVLGSILLAAAGTVFFLRDRPSIARLLGRTPPPALPENDSTSRVESNPPKDPKATDSRTNDSKPTDSTNDPKNDSLSEAGPSTLRFEDFLGRPLADWDDVNAALKAAPHYRGMVLAPQTGLAPLRIDPISKYLEFVHLASGAAPEFKGSGRYALTDDTGIVLVLLPGGEFEMGAQSTEDRAAMFDPAAQPDEAPVTRVSLTPYFLGKYEITQAQWTRLTGSNPSRAKPGSVEGATFTLLHPVESISFVDTLAALQKVGLDLPTEAQWEHACRAGTRTPWFSGARAEMLERYANLADTRTRDLNPDALKHLAPEEFAPYSDPHANTAPIHAHAANAFGFHDTAGNVAEWCKDVYGSYAEPTAAGDGGRGGGLSENAEGARVARGGSYAFGPAAARSGARARAAIDLARPFLGARAARALDR